jgi:ring-1,2-phenylacetyl-CoA epoxidase subunit PaaD
MPYVSIVDLGIVRAVVETQEALEVTLTPTFSACPAMEQMQSEAVHALQSLTNKSITVKQKLSPAWSSDWISPAGQAKLLAAGIVPPAKRQECRDSQNSNETVGIQAVHFHPRLNCPRCASKQSELLSAFSSTSCKALYRCTSCLEPFEVIKTI